MIPVKENLNLINFSLCRYTIKRKKIGAHTRKTSQSNFPCPCEIPATLHTPGEAMAIITRNLSLIIEESELGWSSNSAISVSRLFILL
jgi:hypothetical protein